MAEGVQVSQRTEVTAFNLRVVRSGRVFMYEIADRAPGVNLHDVAEVLFSIALDLSRGEKEGLSSSAYCVASMTAAKGE
jgi:hypothetical protein